MSSGAKTNAFYMDQRPAERCLLERALRPAIVISKFLGYGRSDGGWCQKTCYNLYFVANLLVYSFLVGRFASLLQVNIGLQRMSMQLAGVSWMTSIFCSAISLCYNIRCRKFETLFNFIVEYRLDDLLRQQGHFRRVRTVLIVSSVVAVVYYVLNAAMNSLQFVNVVPSLIYGYMLFLKDLDPLMVVLNAVVIFFLFAHQYVYVLVCFYVAKIWEAFADEIVSSFEKRKLSFDLLAEQAVERHQQLLQVSQHISDAFGFYALSLLSLAMPTLITELYTMFQTSDPTQLAMLGLWLFGSAMQLVIICYAAVIVYQASKAKDSFYVVYAKWLKDVRHAPQRSLTTMQLSETIMSRMEHHEVGITICNLSLLNNAFVLAMLSVVFNYFFLLVQFAQGGDPNTDGCPNVTVSS